MRECSFLSSDSLVSGVPVKPNYLQAPEFLKVAFEAMCCITHSLTRNVCLAVHRLYTYSWVCSGLETLLSDVESVLLSKEAQVWVPALKSGDSPLGVTPPPGDLIL